MAEFVDLGWAVVRQKQPQMFRLRCAQHDRPWWVAEQYSGQIA